MTWRNYILSPVKEITPATGQIITTEEAKDWLKISYAQEDAIIDNLIISATQLLQKGLSISLLARQLLIRIQHSGCTPFKLPYGPISTLDLVEYKDCNCIAVPFSTAIASTYGMNGDYFSGAAGYYNITYTAGPFPDSEAAKLLVKQQVAYMFENRGDAIQTKLNPDIKIESIPFTNNEWI